MKILGLFIEKLRGEIETYWKEIGEEEEESQVDHESMSRHIWRRRWGKRTVKEAYLFRRLYFYLNVFNFGLDTII